MNTDFPHKKSVAWNLSARVAADWRKSLSWFTIVGLRTPKTIFKQNLEAASGFEPLHRGFADLSLNHLGTPP
jgi:hypothetical protein